MPSLAVAEQRPILDFERCLEQGRVLGRPTVFLIPGLGGRASAFSQVVAELPGICSFGLELPGFDGSSPPLDTIDDIARALCEQVQAAAPRGPIALLGYSLGGVIAYEMTRQLEQGGRTVVFLGLLDTVVPEQMRRRSRKEVLRVWMRFLLSDDRRCRLESVRRRLLLSWTRLMKRLRPGGRRVRVLGQEDPSRSAPDYESDAMQALWAATFKASRTYRPAPLPHEACLFRSTLGAVLAYPPQELYGQWETLTAKLRVVTLPGGHLDVLRPPAARVIAQALVAALGIYSLDA